ncbi:MAG: CFI-box-CTERM domain-containing protein [candidate division NC10 bacterium]
MSGSGGSGGGCFIATAAFGSYFDPRVKILRDFRDTFPFTNHAGQSFVNWYYKVSPPMADFIRTREIMKTVVRILLFPAVGFASLCLEIGILPTLLGLLFSAVVIYLGIRRFFRFRHDDHAKNRLLRTICG